MQLVVKLKQLVNVIYPTNMQFFKLIFQLLNSYRLGQNRKIIRSIKVCRLFKVILGLASYLQKYKVNTKTITQKMEKKKDFEIKIKMGVCLFSQKQYKMAAQYFLEMEENSRFQRREYSRWKIIEIQNQYMMKMNQKYQKNSFLDRTIFNKLINSIKSECSIFTKIIKSLSKNSKINDAIMESLKKYVSIFSKQQVKVSIQKYNQNLKSIQKQYNYYKQKKINSKQASYQEASLIFNHQFCQTINQQQLVSPFHPTLLEFGYIDYQYDNQISYCFKPFIKSQPIQFTSSMFQSFNYAILGTQFLESNSSKQITHIIQKPNSFGPSHILFHKPQSKEITSNNSIPQTQLISLKQIPTRVVTVRPKKHRGLKNIGNTCYMNSGIQCLLYSNALTQYFDRQKPTKTNFLKGYSSFIQQMLKNDEKFFVPKQLKSLIGKQNSEFNDFNQHDSCQLITTVINAIHSDLNQVVYSKYTIEPKENDQQYCDEFIKKDQHRSKSIIDQLIFGRFKTEYKCFTCKKVMLLFQKFSVVHLPIVGKKKQAFNNFKDCLAQFNSNDYLTDKQNQMICNNCQDCRMMMKTMKIFRPAQILIFSLKRFDERSKLTHKVSMPLQLKISEITIKSKPVSNVKYELFGVINHFGSLSSGHYTADCRDDNQWYQFNDSHVKNINKEYEVKQQGYVFFYQVKRQRK